MSTDRSLSRRTVMVMSVVVAALALGACGDADASSTVTLPPIFVTTTTLVTPTTVDERIIFYEVKAGESLSRIADKYCVPRDELIRLYEERFPGKDPNGVQEGATIELPNPRIVVLADCVPEATIAEN